MSNSKYNSYSSIDEVQEGLPHGTIVLRWHPVYPKDNLHLGASGIKLKVRHVGPRNKPYPIDFRVTTELAHSLLQLESVEVRPGVVLKGAERYWPERKENATTRKRKAAARKGAKAKWDKVRAEQEAEAAAKEAEVNDAKADE